MAHAAGLDGEGGSSYIDDVILRDRDANTNWFAASDGTLEQRRYYCQNWRADVVAIVTDGGVMDERVWYSAYGVPFGMPAGDCDSDGDFDALDSALISSWAMLSLYDARADVNLDGTVNNGDATAATTETLGWETLSGIDSRKGYAGYEHAPELAGATYHVRYRVFKAELGRWLQRDPLDYLDGMSLYAYVQGLALAAADPYGLFLCVGSCEPPSPPPARGPGSGTPAPPVCVGGTCGPASPPSQPSGPGGPGPIICSGGGCTVPIIETTYSGECGTAATIPTQPGDYTPPRPSRPRPIAPAPPTATAPVPNTEPDWCSDSLYCYKLYQNRRNDAARNFAFCAAGGGGAVLGAGAAACFASCKYLRPSGIGFVACIVGCGVIDVGVTAYTIHKCWDWYMSDEAERRDVITYCACLNARARKCKGDKDKEDQYHDVKCSGVGFPMEPGIPVD